MAINKPVLGEPHWGQKLNDALEDLDSRYPDPQVAADAEQAAADAAAAKAAAESAAASVAREQANGVAGLDGAGKLYETRLPATVARQDQANSYQVGQVFAAPSAGTDPQYTGVAADFTGDVKDMSASGGTFSRVSISFNAAGGTNGVRGDSGTSTAANGAGASYFDGLFIGHSGAGFAGKGSAQGLSFIGALAAHPTGAYGEFGGITSGMTNDRPDGLAAASEMSLHANVQAKNHVLGVIMSDQAGVSGLAGHNWARGLYVISGGSQRSGDAVYVSGAAGWTNFLVCKDTADATVFRVDSTGTVFASVFFTTGDLYVDKVRFHGDGERNLRWGAGSPEGVVSASPGSLYLNTNGGAATTLYVKQTGTGATGWVGK